MSVLTNELIKLQVKEYYHLENIIKIKKIPTGSADLFHIWTNDRKEYILKEFQINYSNKEIIKEEKILKHLCSSGINVPEYVKTEKGKVYYIYKQKYIIIQKFISGVTKRLNEGTHKEMIDCAKNLAYIIKALENFPHLEKDTVSKWISQQKLEEGITKHKKILAKCTKKDEQIKKDMMNKIKMLKQIKKLDFKDIEKITYKNTHGDYNVLQLIYDHHHNIKATIDFVSAKEKPIIWEIIRSYSYIDKCCQKAIFNIDHFVEYVKIFSDIVKLNKYDLKYIAPLYLVQILTSDFGYKQYLEHKDKAMLAFGVFRTKLCEYLLINSSVIFKRLNTEVTIRKEKLPFAKFE